MLSGADEILLQTRTRLLTLLDVEADAVDISGLLRELLHSEPVCELVVLCHTVVPEARQTITAAAEEHRIPVYQLETSVAPKAFLAQVSVLLSAE